MVLGDSLRDPGEQGRRACGAAQDDLRIANDLSGSVDGWDFKSYVLGMLFYRFISENLAAYLNEQEGAVGKPDVRLRHAVGR